MTRLGATLGWGATVLASAAAACGAPEVGAPSVQAPAILVAEMALPPIPSTAAVLRVSVAPTSTAQVWQALLQATLQIESHPTSAVRLAPWSLHPPDQAATFVVRVPPGLQEAARAGQRLRLTVTASPLVSTNPLPPAPSFEVSAAWDVLVNK